MITPQINLNDNVQFDVLWENTAITNSSTFATQTITLNKSVLDYNILGIQYRSYPNPANQVNVELYMHPKNSYQGCYWFNGNGSQRGCRKFYVSNNGYDITFSTGYFNNSWTNNTYGVPVRIYGIDLGQKKGG